MIINKIRYTMKTNIWKSALVVLAAVFALVSCKDPEPEQKPDPVFPSSVVKETVAAGESVDISINPNMEWEVSISGDGSGNVFWIDDDGSHATRVSGKEAGAVTITIEFDDNEEFDRNRVCTVTLSMGGKSKEIAEITRLALARTFELYAGVPGDYEFTDNFGENKVTEAVLVTFAGNTDYSLPVRVVTNYDWNLNLPDWLDAVRYEDKEVQNVNSGKAGVSEFLLVADLSAEVSSGAEELVKFLDSANPEAANTLKVKLPAFEDRVEYTLSTTFEFNAAGAVKNHNDTYLEGLPAFFELLATAGTEVRLVGWDEEAGRNVAGNVTWASVSKTLYDYYPSDAYLAKYTVEIPVAENTELTARYADVLIIPSSMAGAADEDLLDPATGKIAEEFAGFVIGRIAQAAASPQIPDQGQTTGTFTLVSGSAEFTELSEDSELYMALCSELSVTDVYQLVTTDKNVALSLDDKGLWGVKELDPLPPFSQHDTELFHVEATVEDPNSTFMISTTETERAEAVIVITKAGADEVTMLNYAAIHIIYDPAAEVEIPSPFAFADPQAAEGIATLEICPEDILAEIVSQQYGIKEKTVYLLTYTDPAAFDLEIEVPGKPFGDSSYNSVDPGSGMPLENYWLTHKMKGAKKMTVEMKESGKVDYFVWLDGMYKPVGALVCTYLPAVE